jgi:hypothetical protein
MKAVTLSNVNLMHPLHRAMRECSRQAGLLSTDRDVARGLAKQLGHEDTFKLLEAGVGSAAGLCDMYEV